MNTLNQLSNKLQTEGLTIDEKLKLNALVEESGLKQYARCKCATLGGECKLHGIRYKIDPLSYI